MSKILKEISIFYTRTHLKDNITIMFNKFLILWIKLFFKVFKSNFNKLNLVKVLVKDVITVLTFSWKHTLLVNKHYAIFKKNGQNNIYEWAFHVIFCNLIYDKIMKKFEYFLISK